MKTIGIVGGISWLSTVEYYKAINQLVNDKLGGVEAARIILYSVNFAEVKSLTMSGDWAGITSLIQHAAVQVERAGADCLLLGANTMHRIADQIQASVSIPLIHIADVTAGVINTKQIYTVGLLGTCFVMQQDFFKSRLAVQGITTIIPGQDDIDFINDAIYSEFGRGIFLPATKERFLSIIDTLVAQGAMGIIFGCTEIPLLIGQDECPVPVFDTTRIHAAAAVDFALGL